MKKKVLMLATTAAMIEQFNKNNILILEEMGYEVHIVGNWKEGNPISNEKLQIFKKWIKNHQGDFFHISANRNPFHINNIYAYKELLYLIQKNRYEFIHCHTPIGAVLGRLVAHKTNTKIIYTAHGFHFFKGAPIRNWILYYPVEKFLSKWTDVLVTINEEDYSIAKNKFSAKKIYKIPGVGIDLHLFQPSDKYIYQSIRDNKRKELGVNIDDFLIISVGEVNKNKNHEVIIKAINLMPNKNIKYVICGIGNYMADLEKLIAKLGLEQEVFLLGFRNDIKEILYAGDCFAFPSKREGLGLAAIEAMATGLPLITSNIHGIMDYSEDGVTGYTCNCNDVNEFTIAISKLNENIELRKKMANENIQRVEKFSKEKSSKVMKKVYLEV